jgi:transcriptional regulator with XRE-family HTH domain
MDWKQLIADLMKAGVLQTQIASECGVSQGAVSDLHRGTTKRPNFEFGDKLRALHAAKCPGEPENTSVAGQGA